MPACDSIAAEGAPQLPGGNLADGAAAVAGGDFVHVLLVGSTQAVHGNRRRLAGFLEDSDLPVEQSNQATLDVEATRIVRPAARCELPVGGNLERVVVFHLGGRLLRGGL